MKCACGGHLSIINYKDYALFLQESRPETPMALLEIISVTTIRPDICDTCDKMVPFYSTIGKAIIDIQPFEDSSASIAYIRERYKKPLLDTEEDCGLSVLN